MNDKSGPRTVLITGAYGGIGYDVAQGFLKRGDNVVPNGCNGEKLAAAADRLDRPSRIAVVEGDIAE